MLDKFLISLESIREERRESIDNILSYFPETKIVDAINGKELELSEHCEEYLATFGCLISHLSIFNHCIENNISTALILEDDILMSRHQMERLKKEFQDVDLKTFTWHSQPKKFLCAACYQIKDTTMKKVLDNLDIILKNTILYHVDRLITNTISKNSLEFKISGVNLDQGSLQSSHTRSRSEQVKTSVVWASPKKILESDLKTIRELIKKPLRILCELKDQN